jgi:hypothetical protein
LLKKDLTGPTLLEMRDPSKIFTFGRIEEKVQHGEAVAEGALANENLAERFERLEKDEEAKRLSADLNERRAFHP